MERKLIVISAVWCPSCLILNKHLKKLKEKYQNLEIEKFDYDLDEEIVKQYNVGNKLPVIILEQQEKEERRLIGEKSYEEIINFIEGDVN